ncbi:LOW QUALITY PROTEIN: olfactory receptor OR1R1 [Dama dama]
MSEAKAWLFPVLLCVIDKPSGLTGQTLGAHASAPGLPARAPAAVSAADPGLACSFSSAGARDVPRPGAPIGFSQQHPLPTPAAPAPQEFPVKCETGSVYMEHGERRKKEADRSRLIHQFGWPACGKVSSSRSLGWQKCSQSMVSRSRSWVMESLQDLQSDRSQWACLSGHRRLFSDGSLDKQRPHRGGHSMALANLTSRPAFLLLGLTDGTDVHPLLFLLFLGVYLVNALGNVSMVVLVRSDGALRSPMYYFLGHLSLVDIGFTTVTVPRLLAGLLHPGQAVSFQGCFAQMYFFVALGITESYLLAAMSYDRTAAVCRPLHYAAVMTPARCSALVAASWAVAHLHSLLHTLLISELSFPRAARVRHFFCDMTVMLSVATSDTSAAQTAIFSEGLAVVLTPLLLVVLLRAHPRRGAGVRSAGGRRRAISTCGAHLVAVSLFFGSILSVYFRPSSAYSARYDRLASVVYAVVTPTLNPFIYSLRNKEVKGSLKRGLRWRAAPPRGVRAGLDSLASQE